MNYWITLVLSIVLSHFVLAQTTFPTNGVEDEREIFHAFMHATVYASPTEVYEDATLIIKSGKVVEVNTGGAIPKTAIEHDCKGKIIYASFIDAYSGINVGSVKKKAKGRIEGTDSQGYWNQAIHPEVEYHARGEWNKKQADDWLACGIGGVNVHKRDGIMRGSSQLILLGELRPNEQILLNKAADHLSFSKGTSSNDYPSSFIGAVALVRQAYYDAQWYHSRPDPAVDINPSLEALNQQKSPSIFELNHSLSARNVQDIGTEFGLDFIMVGSGREYQLVNDLSPNARFILPLHYPKPFDVDDPYQANAVSLGEMQFWEFAPYNAKLLDSAGISFCLSRDTIRKGKTFLKNLRRTLESGLDHDIALAALTTNPADWLGVSQSCGTLTTGKLANFIVSEGLLGTKGFRVSEHWIRGTKVYSSPQAASDIVGKYSLVIGKDEFQLEVKSIEKETIKAEILSEDGVDRYKLKVTLDDELVGLQISLKDKADTQRYFLSGKISFNGGVWDGRGTDEAGNWVSWAAIKDRNEKDTIHQAKSEEKTEIDIPKPFQPYVFPRDSARFPSKFVITNAVVWTAADTGILERADVLIEDGIIKQIGQNILFPSELKRINANGRHLTPGFVDEHSHIAVRGGVNEWAQSSSAEVRIADGLDPKNINVFRQLSGGVTTAQLLHGSANPIGGQSALIKLKWGLSADEMLIDGPRFIKFALGENVKRSNRKEHGDRFPLTRMGVEQTFIDAFTRARAYDESRNKPSFRTDLELEAISEVMKGERFVTCHSYVQSEILMLMQVADSFGFKVNTFTHVLEGYKVADELKRHGVSASTFSDWWAYKYEVNDAIPYNAALLNNAGVNTGINSDDAEMGRRLNQEAAKSIKYGGLTREEAIKLITINPAKMLHLDQSIGSIEVGKSADLVLWSDDPLSVYAHVEKTFIEGELYFDRSKLADQEEEIRAERARLITKMSREKGAKDFPSKPKQSMHCDSMLKNYMK